MIVEIQVFGEKELQAAFVQIEDFAGHLDPAFERIAPEVFGDIRERFDASGPGWAPLAESTIKRKGHTRILRDKDDLYASFQKGAPENITRIKPTEAEFGTSDFKAMFHQTGTARMPKRTIIEVTREQEAKYARIALDVFSERARALGFQVS